MSSTQIGSCSVFRFSRPQEIFQREGLHLFAELPRNTTREFLLATDLHAGNVLRAEREPWLLEQRSIVGLAAWECLRASLTETRINSPEESFQTQTPFI